MVEFLYSTIVLPYSPINNSFQPTCSRVNDIQTNNNGTLMAGCYNNGDVYAFELLDSVAGTIRDVKVQELNFGAEESD